MWNKIGRNKARKPQEHSKKCDSDSNCHNSAAQKRHFPEELQEKNGNERREGWCHCSDPNRKESSILIQELDSQDNGSSEKSTQASRRKKERVASEQTILRRKKTFKTVGDSSISSILSGQLTITPHTKVVVGMSHHDFNEQHSYYPDGDGSAYQRAHDHEHGNPTDRAATMESDHQRESMAHYQSSPPRVHRQTVQILEPSESHHDQRQSVMSQRNMSVLEPPPQMTRTSAISQRGMSVFQQPSQTARASALSQRGMSVFEPPPQTARASALSQRGMSVFEPPPQTARASALSQRGMSTFEPPPRTSRASAMSQRGMSVFEPPPQVPRQSTMSQRSMSMYEPPPQMERPSVMSQRGMSVFEQAPVIAASSNQFTPMDFAKQEPQYDTGVYPSEGGPPQIATRPSQPFLDGVSSQAAPRPSQAFLNDPHALSRELSSHVMPSMNYNDRASSPANPQMTGEPSLVPVRSQGAEIISRILSPPPSAYEQPMEQSNTCRLCMCGGKRQCLICYCRRENMPRNMCRCGTSSPHAETCGGGQEGSEGEKGGRHGNKKDKKRGKSKGSDKAAKKEAKKREKEEKKALKKEQKAKEKESRTQSKKSKTGKKKKGKKDKGQGDGTGRGGTPCACCKCDENPVCPCRGFISDSSDPTLHQKSGCCKRKKKTKKEKKGEKKTRKPATPPTTPSCPPPVEANRHSEIKTESNCCKSNNIREDQEYCNFPDTPCPGLCDAKECCDCSSQDKNNPCGLPSNGPQQKCGPGGVCGEGQKGSRVEAYTSRERVQSVAYSPRERFQSMAYTPRERFQSVAFPNESRGGGGCDITSCPKKKQSCDCYTTKAICSCNCTSKVRCDPQVMPALIDSPEVGNGDSPERRSFEFHQNSTGGTPFTSLPTTLTPSGNVVINVSKKQGPSGSNKHFVPPCVLYLDCTKVKDLCVIIRNNREEPREENC